MDKYIIYHIPTDSLLFFRVCEELYSYSYFINKHNKFLPFYLQSSTLSTFDSHVEADLYLKKFILSKKGFVYNCNENNRYDESFYEVYDINEFDIFDITN